MKQEQRERNLADRTDPRAARSRPRWMVRAGEALLALALVVAFFLGFLEILSLSFPQGTGLKELVGRTASSSSAARRGINWVDALGQDELDEGPIIARLEVVRRSVKDRQVGAVTWVDSTAGKPLVDRHGVQTLDDSSARIQFVPGETLSLGENSLVILRGMKRKRSSGRRRASVVLLGGEIRGATGASVTPVDVELETSAGTGRVRSIGGRAARYKVTVNADTTATYSVYDGEIAVTNKGRTVIVPEQHAVTVHPAAPPPSPAPLPDPPRLADGAATGTHYYREIPPLVTFGWDPSPRANAYRLEIARDEAFLDVADDRRVAETTFQHGRLPPGTYFWRASALDGSAESDSSRVRRLELIRDAIPPPLQVELNAQDPAWAGPLLVRGSVEPGARMFFKNESVPVGADGRFEIEIELHPGPNAIVIEAVDRAGNVSYFSRTIDAKHRETAGAYR